MATKTPIRLSGVFSDPELIELPDGRLIPVRPIDGIGFDLYTEMEADPEKGNLIWDITARCLPSLTLKEVKGFTPAECAAVVAVAVGQVKLVLDLVEQTSKNGNAPVTTAEPGAQRSSTLSDSSSSASQESAAEHSVT